jgi:hypothetical protein
LTRQQAPQRQSATNCAAKVSREKPRCHCSLINLV